MGIERIYQNKLELEIVKKETKIDLDKKKSKLRNKFDTCPKRTY